MAPSTKRLEFQTLLQDILGSPNVYFQPPSNKDILYPCIVYNRDRAKSIFADNSPYSYVRRYQVTYIDSDPDASVPDDIAKLPMSTPVRTFTAGNLHHFVYTLYF